MEVGNDPGWSHVPVKSPLEHRTGLPVWVENDVRAATMAEYHYTNAGERAPQCLLYVSVTEGVGVGIVFHGNVYAGPSMAAGEFGRAVMVGSWQIRPFQIVQAIQEITIIDAVFVFIEKKEHRSGSRTGEIICLVKT